MPGNQDQRKPNRLINATSPYLLQHAYNPVDWYEWGEEALAKANDLGVPILVSIGYSSCHWCHVMERESFEDEFIATIMNEHFVCIKVDREERPDIDQVYMDALQAMGMNGGWPLNVFLTEDQKPFFGGTYFQPQSWTQLLRNITNAYDNRRTEIQQTANELTQHLQSTGVAKMTGASSEEFDESLQHMFTTMEMKFDNRWGGLDRAPKFILPSVWRWLLRYWYTRKDESSLNHVLFTLKKIAAGGIYDQIGGGFARYSVDNEWFAPHFEKMLYDNAQLMSLYSEAYKISKDQRFKSVLYQTFDWLIREMQSNVGGFCSALDADSEGIEGKYYTWTWEELTQTLGDEAPLAAAYYGAKTTGNWEHGLNILTQPDDTQGLAAKYNITEAELAERVEQASAKMLKSRAERIRPGLDDKVLTSWNAMMVVGLLDAYDALGDIRFKGAAQSNITFLLDKLYSEKILYRSYKGKRSHIQGFLDDYAFMIKALLRLYAVEFDESLISKAADLTKYVIDHFYDDEEKYFHYSSSNSERLIARRKELFDNVIPSSNSVMAENLFILGTLLENPWKELAAQMVDQLSTVIRNEPVYMSNWGMLHMMINRGLNEVVFTGKSFLDLRAEFATSYHPFCILMGSNQKTELPLVMDKVSPVESAIYVCYNKTCKLPVHSVPEAVAQLQ